MNNFIYVEPLRKTNKSTTVFLCVNNQMEIYSIPVGENFKEQAERVNRLARLWDVKDLYICPYGIGIGFCDYLEPIKNDDLTIHYIEGDEYKEFHRKSWPIFKVIEKNDN